MRLARLVPVVISLATGVWLLNAQGPGGFGGAGKSKAGPPPVIDFSGSWTGNMQEDNAERVRLETGGSGVGPGVRVRLSLELFFSE